MKKILILGSKGMLGTDALKIFKEEGFGVRGGDIENVDITNYESLKNFIKKEVPEIIFNAAAFTDVDGAEKKRKEAYLINYLGASNIALLCFELKILMVHISTDYIFDGEKEEGYFEDEVSERAINFYGETKLLAEKEIMRIFKDDEFLICRTQWLYGKNGKNFVKTILDLSKKSDEIKVVNDQFGNPTYTKSLLRQVVYLLKEGKRGVFHTVDAGEPISWFDFAGEILKLTGSSCKLLPISSGELKREAKRPKYGILRNTKIPENIRVHWKDSLIEYLKEEKFI